MAPQSALSTSQTLTLACATPPSISVIVDLRNTEAGCRESCEQIVCSTLLQQNVAPNSKNSSVCVFDQSPG